jgi:hypothetical protein
MATISNVQLSITRDFANADFDISYTVNWSGFDQATNLTYLASWKLVGDDTSQDGDNLPVGDDPIPVGLVFARFLSSGGQASTTITEPTRTLAWAGLNEDDMAGNTDDEIRAVVTLTPQLPVPTSRESTAVVVVAP